MIFHRVFADLRRFTLFAFCQLIAIVITTDSAAAAEAGTTSLGHQLHHVAVAPFLLLLLSIAILPLWIAGWWEHNRNKAIVSVLTAVPAAVWLLSFGDAGQHALQESVLDYVSFIILLGSLFVISGGIYVQGSLSGTPLVNTGILGFGAIIANLVGTTGASVLLIRPLLRANASRQKKVHVVVFFIFTVSNCGGVLTPLGDPPLFMGFLRGVPFEWTLQLWPQWLLVNCILLAVFNMWDQAALYREERQRPGSQLEALMKHEPLRVRGLFNLVFLFGIVGTIYAAGRGLGHNGEKWPFGWQEAVMFVLALLSYLSTPREIHASNRFTFGPIIEVAVLFAGIFVTMVPAIQILNARGQELYEWGIRTPAHFFWAAGVLSSFLDNAPTYITFAATAAGVNGIAAEGRYLADFLTLGEQAMRLLAAISCGAVFMGANTYIGNGPNFMVKAIAEESGVKMPSFFGYMLYSISILIPIFIIVTWVFFV
jgi:Na+/H+ antiporter NhaD/arsenite permease-like protein